MGNAEIFQIAGLALQIAVPAAIGRMPMKALEQDRRAGLVLLGGGLNAGAAERAGQCEPDQQQ